MFHGHKTSNVLARLQQDLYLWQNQSLEMGTVLNVLLVLLAVLDGYDQGAETFSSF